MIASALPPAASQPPPASRADDPEEPSVPPEPDFWRRHLDGSVSGLELPFDFPPTAGKSSQPDHRRLELGPELTAGIRRLADACQMTPREILSAAWVVVLRRWTHQEDVVLGVALTGGELRPARARLEGDPTFREFAKRWRATLAEVHAQPDLPAAGEELFRVAAAFAPPSDAAAKIGAGVHGGRLDLALLVNDRADEWQLEVAFDAGRFRGATIERMLRSLRTVTAAIAEDSSLLLSRIPVVPTEELNRMLREWNETALPFDRTLCIHEAFAREVRKAPDAVAVVAGGERWTYAQLDAAAERLAETLRAEGVGPDMLVGVHLERTPGLLIGILGVLKAGGAYVPLDPVYPAERLRFIVEDARLQVLVTQQSLAGRIVAEGLRVVCFHASESQPVVARTSPPAAKPRRTLAENLAYVIYTSGSTGQPKGVCLTHQVVLALVAWAQTLYTLEDLGGVLFATSACFDVSIFEMFAPLCLGGKIIMARNILDLPKVNPPDEIRLISGVPSAVAELVRRRALPPTVRTVNVAGEPCPQSLVDDLHATGHVRNVYDVYGPTETTVYSVGGARFAGGQPTIGRPLPNERVYVLDSQFQPVPQGVRGELFIGGEKLARGYLNRPELTAQRFLEVPTLPGERLYRTGDAVRWLPDGTLEFLGRLDRQVKIRGFRVEPGEIESVLRQHPAVKECAIVPRDAPAGGKILAGYVVLDPAAANDGVGVDALREFLSGRLPEYLVPTAFVLLDRLPRSPNGKLDARALPAPTVATQAQGDGAAPRDELERQLVAIWEEVLNVRPVGVRDRFLDLGGHSLLAARMFEQVTARTGRSLPVSALFQAPSIEKLAEAIRREGAERRSECLVEIQPKGSRPPIFWLHTLGGDGGAGLFTYAQLAEELGPDQPSYGLVAPPGEPPATLEEMAAIYAREIRRVQPRGPHRVGGYCFGGILAYEVARQLAAEGGEPGLVILLEAAPPNPPRGQPGLFSTTFVKHAATTLPAWAKVALGDPRDLARRAHQVGRRIGLRVRDRFVRRPASQPGAAQQISAFINMTQYPAEFKARAEAHFRAMAGYHAGRFAGEVFALHTYRPRLLMYPVGLQWGFLAPKVTAHCVPGTHEDLLHQPQVREVARMINRHLATDTGATDAAATVSAAA